MPEGTSGRLNPAQVSLSLCTAQSWPLSEHVKNSLAVNLQIQNLPPVQFLDQAGPITPIQGLTFGNQMAQMQGLPALTYINEGRSRRNRGRRH